jgi:hypothetical protein
VEGITYTFPSGTMLAPGERIVLAKNLVSFEAIFGEDVNVVGGFEGQLSNGGERLELRRADGGLILAFTYSDQAPWPLEVDGSGYSLVLIHPFSNPDHSDPQSWRASLVMGGSPGADDRIDYATWKSDKGNHADHEDRDGDGLTTGVEYFLGGNPNLAEPLLAPSAVVQADGSVVMTIDQLAGSVGVVSPEASTDLHQWSIPENSVFFGTTRLPVVPAKDRLVFRIPAPIPAGRLFVRCSFRQ